MQAESSSLLNSEMVPDLYPFSNATDQEKFYQILQSLRCGVCQNQSLRDSIVPVALDLKSAIYQQVLANHSEQQIIEFVSARYGAVVLYDPPLLWQTSMLWFGPLLMLVIATFYLKCVLKK